jgi:pyruvate dehydrogenase E2 component (dihydrolipoamide acetyltransferase)
VAQVFRLPDIGEGLTEAEIVGWHIAVGQEVAIDEPLVEVETEKAVTDIPSPFAGVVLHHGAGKGEILAVGEILVVVGEPGETWSASEPEQSATTGGNAVPIVGTLSEDAQVLTSPASQLPALPPTAFALPIVRQLARDLGVDLEAIEGTGENGSITREDVVAASSTSHPTAGPGSLDPDDEHRPLSSLRRTIANNMSRAWSEIPQVSSFYEVDATGLLAMRQSIQEEHDVRVPIDALVIGAVIPALRAFPEFNATLNRDELIIHHRYDIGIAVNAAEGLMVVVIRDAGTKALLELGSEVRRLGENARSRTLRHDELSGQTFTISNIGAVAGGGPGTPIVPYGTMGILAVGRALEKPIVRHGRIEAAPIIPLSLSYDHRVIDGAIGRRFLALIAENLAEPSFLMTQ